MGSDVCIHGRWDDAAIQAMMTAGAWSRRRGQHKPAARFGRPGFKNVRSLRVISFAIFMAVGKSRGSSHGMEHLHAPWSEFPLRASEISLLESEFAAAGRSQGTINLNAKDRTPSVPFITGAAGDVCVCVSARAHEFATVLDFERELQATLSASCARSAAKSNTDAPSCPTRCSLATAFS